MAQDVTQIRIAPSGNVMVAPTGTTDPADEIAAWPAGWVNLGLLTDAGVKFRDSKTLATITAWQLFYAARRIVTARDAEAIFVLEQWNKVNVTLGFGGGTVAVSSGAGHYKYTPPSPEVIDYRKIGWEWQDGSLHYRVIMSKGLVTNNVETDLVRTGAALLPITFGLVGQPGVDPWVLYTDDPAFA